MVFINKDGTVSSSDSNQSSSYIRGNNGRIKTSFVADFFWDLMNVVTTFFQTLVSTDATDQYINNTQQQPRSGSRNESGQNRRMGTIKRTPVNNVPMGGGG